MTGADNLTRRRLILLMLIFICATGIGGLCMAVVLALRVDDLCPEPSQPVFRDDEILGCLTVEIIVIPSQPGVDI